MKAKVFTILFYVGGLTCGMLGAAMTAYEKGLKEGSKTTTTTLQLECKPELSFDTVPNGAYVKWVF